MAKIVTMGEIMLKLSTPNNEKFIQADEFDINHGGGEVSVVVSLANYGHDTQFVIVAPANSIGECVVAALRKYNVGTKLTSRKGERLGIYYLETGSAMRASNAVYDRAHPSISIAVAVDFDFDEIFKDADWFHFTGITPMVSDAAVELIEAACRAAKAHGVTVSVDLNFRKKLWSSEKVQKVVTNLTQYADVCIGSEEDVKKVPGFKPGNTDVASDEPELAGYVDIFNQMADKFGFKYIISSLHESFSTSNNGRSACIMNGKAREFYHSRKYFITPTVGRVGGGDSFAVGLVCGLADGKDMKAALEFTVAASALKYTIPDDFNLMTRANVDSLADGDGSGRVQR